MNPFSVQTIAISLLGYDMSWIELFGTAFNLWSVWLVARRNVLTWPVGIVGVLLFMVLFYQIRLYSDAIEQVYYLVTSLIGWWQWSRSPAREGAVLGVHPGSRRSIVVWAVLTVAASAALGTFMAHAHQLLPTLFPEPASFPILDALTTIMSFTATWLMIRKQIECWAYWIVVDVIGIGLYYAKGTVALAALYTMFLVMACRGLLLWMRAMRAEHNQAGASPAAR